MMGVPAVLAETKSEEIAREGIRKGERESGGETPEDGQSVM